MTDVLIKPIKLSDGHNFRNRAEYEVAELRHVLLGEPKPDLMDPKYSDVEPVPEGNS